MDLSLLRHAMHVIGTYTATTGRSTRVFPMLKRCLKAWVPVGSVHVKLLCLPNFIPVVLLFFFIIFQSDLAHSIIQVLVT